MNHRDYVFLQKINKEVSIGMDFVKGISIDKFLNDEVLKRAVCMTAINVGELVKALTIDTTIKYKNIPWRKIAGFRDIAAHKYESLSMGDVYKVIIEDYPSLKNSIDNILKNEIDEKS